MQNKISLSSSSNNNSVSISKDASNYYSDLAKKWAVSDEKVENTDYSSKYYAQKSAELINESIQNVKDEISHQLDIAKEQANISVAMAELISSTDNANTDLSNLSQKGQEIIDSKLDKNCIVTNFGLGDSRYSSQQLNSISWLASNGQWNSGAVYLDFYNMYVDKIGEVFGSGTIKASSDSYSDYDLVINTVDNTFRLPLLDGSEYITSSRYDNLTLEASGSTYTVPANGLICVNTITQSNSSNGYIQFINNRNNYKVRGQALHSGTWLSTVQMHVLRGDVITVEYGGSFNVDNFQFFYAKGNGTLYFYVGEVVQDANMMDVGRIAELLATKPNFEQASGLAFPSNRYIDLTLGASGSTYIAPANGYYFIYCHMISTNAMVYMNIDNVYGEGITDANWNSSAYSKIIPIKKGSILTINYAGMFFDNFRFIYAEGSKGE